MGERILAGVTSDTFNYLQLGAGAIIKNFEYDAIDSPTAFKEAFITALKTEQNLGGTRGGITMNITPTTRKIEIDGTATTSFVGDEIVESWNCMMGASLVQFSPQTMQEAFPNAEFTNVDTDNNIVAMRIKQQFGKEDYATNHVWITTTAYGYLMVAMHNTLSRLSGDISSTDNGEAVMPVEIRPKNLDFTDIDYLPVEIWFINMTDGTIDIGKIVQP